MVVVNVEPLKNLVTACASECSICHSNPAACVMEWVVQELNDHDDFMKEAAAFESLMKKKR